MFGHQPGNDTMEPEMRAKIAQNRRKLYFSVARAFSLRPIFTKLPMIIACVQQKARKKRSYQI